MEINEYQKQAMTFLNPEIKKEELLLNALMGLCSESGEAMDLLKKHLFQGHELSKEELIKELGDVSWYLAEAATALDCRLENVMKENIAKLEKRFPNGFDPCRSMNRKEYHFYGAGEEISCSAVASIRCTEDLYDLFSDAWCVSSCAPRMAKDWSKENKTLGQCSVTAFLVQDLCGGEVRGIPLEDGNFHCFNVIDGKTFDLTSEQFDHPLNYEKAILQDRDVHFRKEEKRKRYQLLKEIIEKKINSAI